MWLADSTWQYVGKTLHTCHLACQACPTLAEVKDSDEIFTQASAHHHHCPAGHGLPLAELESPCGLRIMPAHGVLHCGLY